MNTLKSSGPRIEPCRTPFCIFALETVDWVKNDDNI
jgi:hypothetical protein